MPLVARQTALVPRRPAAPGPAGAFSGLLARLASPLLFGGAFTPQADAGPRVIFTELARSVRELSAPQDYLELARRYSRNPWVFAAAHRKAADQAAIPLDVVRWIGDEARAVEDTHPLAELLRRVNPFYTLYNLIELNSLYLDLTGNDYWLVFGGQDGAPAEIWPLMPHWVSIVKDPERFIAGYVVRPDGGDAHPFHPISTSPTGTGVLHFRLANPWSIHYGQGPLSAAWTSVLTDEAATEYRYWFYKNSARPDGLLKTDKKLTDGQVQQIREWWALAFQGPSNAHRVAVVDQSLTYQPISTPPKDSEVHRDRELSRPDMLVAFGVSMAVLGLETGDVGRRDEQIRHYYRSTILPMIRSRCATLNEFLVPGFGADLEVRPDLSGVRELQEDEQRRAAIDEIYLRSGKTTINELRARDGQDPVPWGDKPLVPFSIAPLGEGGLASFGALGHAGGARKWWPGIEVPDERGLLWDEVIKRQVSAERDVRPTVLGALLAAGEEVARALRAGLQPETAVTQGLEAGRRLLIAAAIAWLPDALDAAWLRALALIRRARREQRRALKQAEVEVVFDLTIPRLAEYLRSRPVRYADQVAASLSRWFRELLTEQADIGASLEQMAQAVSERFPEIALPRARLIARTEVVSASNLSMTVAYEESGVVEAREWLTARDERVRPTHQAADGQTRRLSEPFEVGGAALRFPGDPEGPPAEIINCRCVTLPVLSEA